MRLNLPNNSAHTSSDVVEQDALQALDILETIKDGFFVMDKDFVILRANKAFEKHSNAKRKNAIGKSLWRVFPHVAYRTSPYWIHYHNVMETRKPATFITENVRKNWVEINAYPVEEGGIAVFIRDVTKRMHAEQAVRQSEERFRALLSGTSDSIYVMTPDFRELKRLQVTGFPAENNLADPNWLQNYIVDEHREHVREVVAEAVEQKKTFAVEHRVKTKAGKIVWMYSRATPIIDEKGEIIEWFGASTDITERRKQLQKDEQMRMLTEQRNALVKINRAKDEFVALASHQLRTPATAVKQYIAMLIGGFAGVVEEKQLKLLKAAYDSNERELRMINDLLKTAQIDGSSHNLKAVKYDIVKLVTDAIDDMRPTLEHRDQRFDFKQAEESIEIKVDVTEVKLAMVNLIENASKYSPRGSTIKIRIKVVPDCVGISVIDQGVGVEEEHQDKIFDKFSRVNNPLSDTVSGSGLGLYWVKRIAEMHGGYVELESKIGKGSRFTLHLPRQKKS